MLCVFVYELALTDELANVKKQNIKKALYLNEGILEVTDLENLLKNS
jgi:hypothetical protein